MPDPINVFRSNMADADALTGLYDYLEANVHAPFGFEDLLRSKVVYAVSAFDKLIHDIVLMGMVQIFVGKRTPTAKYQSEPITLGVNQQLMASGATPPEVVFEQVIRGKLKTLSFQDPDKISDGLSFVWMESHKWQKIAAAILQPEKDVRTKLKLIAARRNSIVHEADIDPSSGAKLKISRTEANDVAILLRNVGQAIYDLTR